MLENTVPHEGMRGGRTGNDTHGIYAVPHTDPAQPESRLGHWPFAIQFANAEAATNSVPGDAGRESDQSSRETHGCVVALANDPASAGVGEDQSVQDTHTLDVSPAKTRRAKARRGAVDHKMCVAQAEVVGSAISDPAMPEDLARQTCRDLQSGGASEVTVSEIGSIAEGRVGHVPCGTQQASADAATQIGSDAEGESGHHFCDPQKEAVALAAQIPSDREDGVDHLSCVTHTTVVDPVIIAEIREQWRRRQAWHRAEKSLTLQSKALCRRLAVDGDKDEADVIYRAAQGDGEHPHADIALAATFPLVEARNGVEKHRKAVESRLRKLAKQLPIASWVEAIPGASLNTLAAIVGEAGDIGAFPYTNPAKLWKRMGLAVMPDGTRQRRVGGEEGVAHGYSPARRSVVWNIGGSLIGGMGRGPRLEPGQDVDSVDGLSDLQRIFVRRIRYEAERDPSHARPVTKAGKESFSKHAAARAKRYVEKRFLLLMWKEWRRATCSASNTTRLYPPVANIISEDKP